VDKCNVKYMNKYHVGLCDRESLLNLFDWDSILNLYILGVFVDNLDAIVNW
jgi:hypothetical protein